MKRCPRGLLPKANQPRTSRNPAPARSGYIAKPTARSCRSLSRKNARRNSRGRTAAASLHVTGLKSVRHSRNGRPSPRCPRMILSSWICVENTADNHPHGLSCALNAETPAGAREGRPISIVGLDDRRMRCCRMKIDRHIKRLRAFEYRPETLVVEKQSSCQTVHHGALKAELVDRALKLVSRSNRINRWQRGKCSITRGMAIDGFVQEIIRATRQRYRVGPVESLGPWRSVRQHLDVDSAFVHFLEP